MSFCIRDTFILLHYLLIYFRDLSDLNKKLSVIFCRANNCTIITLLRKAESDTIKKFIF